LNGSRQQKISYSWMISVPIVRLFFRHEEATGPFGWWTTLGKESEGSSSIATTTTARRFSQSTTISSNPQLIRQHKLHSPFQLLRSQQSEETDFFDILCEAPWNRWQNICNLAVSTHDSSQAMKHSEKETGKIQGGAGKLTCEQIPVDHHVAAPSVSQSNKKTKEVKARILRTLAGGERRRAGWSAMVLRLRQGTSPCFCSWAGGRCVLRSDAGGVRGGFSSAD
jgi:hypothetical protein